ncbi:hypothetical protein IMCC3317_05130 [Kordia antarctica]|uniref:Uncharacterized protein n=1 Tax=Kordia antarctica TaxID=1218801 RepID=A0A7L4ZF67_9FLAO|nr:hypothetical protein [Kordia antarctica]QHI35167.1 hypothetical protein IMCC3317_05130 [Kordia antarctica]
MLLISFFLQIGYGFAQDIKKDKIYLDFSHYKENCEHSDLAKHLKVEKKEGLQFNLCGKAVFLHPFEYKSDTINNKYLSNYSLSKIEEIDQLIINWHRKTKPLFIKKFGEVYPKTTNKNNMFETYLIEKFNNDCFILYQVYWKNQEIQQ